MTRALVAGVDVLRNAPEATAIASWSTRAREGAPVAAPLAWQEIDGDTRPLGLLRDAPERLDRLDPWEGFDESRRTLTASMRRRISGMR